MKFFSLVLVASGVSRRMGRNKLLEELSGGTVVERSLTAFFQVKEIAEFVVVCPPASAIETLLAHLGEQCHKKIIFVSGGETRAQSVQNGLKLVTNPYVLVHDGARPFVGCKLVERIVADTVQYGSAVPALPLVDSIRVAKNGNIVAEADRTEYFRVQTPQGFTTEILKKAYQNGSEATDESGLYLQIAAPHITEGEETNRKITCPEDVFGLNGRVGIGFDVHQMVEGRRFVLGGVEIPFERGEKAHSDGDVLLHALMDALLSAIEERDIGNLFPDNDPAYCNISSAILLQKVLELVANKGRIITGISAIVALQAPKLSPYLPQIVQNIKSLCAAPFVNISATTTEHLGVVGAGGIAAFVTVTLI